METSSTPYHGILQLAEDDRPREKLQRQGASALSYAELLAILIGSGTTKASALQLAEKLLQVANYNLADLSKLTLKQLTSVHGIGPTRAITLAAAFELGRRRRDEKARQLTRITTSKDAFEHLAPFLEDNRHEEFWVLLLNRSNMVLGKKKISAGGVAGTVVDPKIIFHLALEHLASSFVLCHNHPSGNLKPSQQDLDITRKICMGAMHLDLQVADHLIIGNGEYFSFAENGLMKYG